MPLKPATLQKIAKFYRPYVISILLTLLLMTPSYTLKQLILAATLTQSLGIDPEVLNPPSWFLSIYLWVWLGLQCLVRLVPKQVSYITAAIGLTGLSLIVSNSPSHGVNFSGEAQTLGLSFGLLRGVSEMSLGYALRSYSRGLFKVGTTNLKWQMVFVAVQFIAVTDMIYTMFLAPITPWLDLPYIGAVCLLIPLLAHQSDVFSRTVGAVGSRLCNLTKLSLPMFLIHFPIILCWQVHLGENPRKRWVLPYFASVVAAAYLLDKATSRKQLVQNAQVASNQPFNKSLEQIIERQPELSL